MNQERIICWNDDLSSYDNTVPCEIILFGESKILHTWQDALYEIAIACYKVYHDEFIKMNARFDFEDIFSRKMNTSKGTRGLPNDLSHPFIITKKSPSDALACIRKMMNWNHVNDSDIQIRYQNAAAAVITAHAGRSFKASVDNLIHKYDKGPHLSVPNDKSVTSGPAVSSSGKPIIYTLPEASENAIPEADYIRVNWAVHDYLQYNRNFVVRKLVYQKHTMKVLSWKDLIVDACEIMAMNDVKKFVKMTQLRYFSDWFAPYKPYCQMVEPRFIQSARVWVETNHTPEDILSKISLMMQMLHLDISPLEIWVAKAE